MEKAFVGEVAPGKLLKGHGGQALHGDLGEILQLGGLHAFGQGLDMNEEQGYGDKPRHRSWLGSVGLQQGQRALDKGMRHE